MSPARIGAALLVVAASSCACVSCSSPSNPEAASTGSDATDARDGGEAGEAMRVRPCVGSPPGPDAACVEAGALCDDVASDGLYLCLSSGHWHELGEAGPGFVDAGWQCLVCGDACASTPPVEGSSCPLSTTEGCVYDWGGSCGGEWCSCESAKWACRFGDTCGDV